MVKDGAYLFKIIGPSHLSGIVYVWRMQCSDFMQLKEIRVFIHERIFMYLFSEVRLKKDQHNGNI